MVLKRIFCVNVKKFNCLSLLLNKFDSKLKPFFKVYEKHEYLDMGDDKGKCCRNLRIEFNCYIYTPRSP